MTSITEVKGIGPSTAILLAGHGIQTVHDLASATIAQLIAIPGFSEFRAAQVKFSAQMLLKKLEPEGNVETPSASGSVVVSKQDKSTSPPAKEKEKKNKKDKKKTKQGKKGKDKSKKKDTKKAKSKDKSSKKGKKKK